jgi:hypothetical protein
MKLLAIALIVGGILGLVYGSFTYLSDHHNLDLGFVDLSFWERERVNIPVWAGVAAIVGGAFMLFGRKGS